MYFGWLPDKLKNNGTKLFKKGAVVEVVITDKNSTEYASLVGAVGCVVSRREWTKYKSWPIDGDYVCVKFFRTPHDTGLIASHNNIFPVKREYLVLTGEHTCTCDISDLLLRGCKCGGI